MIVFALVLMAAVRPLLVLQAATALDRTVPATRRAPATAAQRRRAADVRNLRPLRAASLLAIGPRPRCSANPVRAIPAPSPAPSERCEALTPRLPSWVGAIRWVAAQEAVG
jgi:hypothetical protein